MTALDGSAWTAEEVQAVLRMGAGGGSWVPVNPEHGGVRTPARRGEERAGLTSGF